MLLCHSSVVSFDDGRLGHARHIRMFALFVVGGQCHSLQPTDLQFLAATVAAHRLQVSSSSSCCSSSRSGSIMMLAGIRIRVAVGRDKGLVDAREVGALGLQLACKGKLHFADGAAEVGGGRGCRRDGHQRQQAHRESLSAAGQAAARGGRTRWSTTWSVGRGVRRAYGPGL